MKFDAIIGNPPYQKLDEGSSGGGSASPLYHHIFKLAKKLDPNFISLIIPARWFTNGKGLKGFREEMLNDTHFVIMHDFTRSQDVFPNVSIKGGICYFLWEREHAEECHYRLHDCSGKIQKEDRFLKSAGSDVFIRYPICTKILGLVQDKREESIIRKVTKRKPFTLTTDFFDETKETLKDGRPSEKFPIEIYGRQNNRPVTKCVRAGFDFLGNKEGKDDPELKKTIKERLNGYKIFVPKARGAGGEAIGEADSTYVLGKPIPGGPNTACTETYLLIGPFETETEANNALSYLKTKTFRLLVSLRKATQDAPRDVYSFVPMQDFSEPWTDEKLYKKYGFNPDQIAFIEKMIAPMEE